MPTRKRSDTKLTLGPTGQAVGAQLKAIRGRRQFTLRSLSERLSQPDINHPMSHTSISQIEGLNRRVDVDDLMALAAALDVAPVALLAPRTDTEEQEVEVTGRGKLTALSAWRWITGRYRMDYGQSANIRWVFDSNPSWDSGLSLDDVNEWHRERRGNN